MGALGMLKNLWTDMAERFRAYLSFGVWDIIDILLVTVLIYFSIQLLRRSSAFSVMKGVFFLVLVLGLSQIMGLHTLYFILFSTLQVGVLAVIVLFQPELRKMLGQVGSTGNLTLGRGGISLLEKCIAETVEACRSLSWDRQGALIVFERRSPLNDFADTGAAVDSAVTAELIKNIFYPKAPLHDGAIIIQNGRITGAGCMLPLTTNQSLGRDLGMRHRAGIGMSEHSDAVVVIVSEETGSMSAAIGGMLKRHLAPETLEKLLRLELLPADPKEGKGFLGGVSKRIRKKGG